MKTIKKIILVCTVFGVGITNAQQQVSEIEAINAAISTLHNKVQVLSKSAETEVKAVHSFSNTKSNVLMYEVVFENGAAILLSGSKAALPVLGYYTKPEHDNGSVFDEYNENVPPGLRTFLFEYAEQLEWCFEQNNIELAYENEWEQLQQPYLQKNSPPTEIIVHPLLKSKWNQGRSNCGQKCDAYNHDVEDKHTHKAFDCEDRKCPAG
jgi:hypothetical protein